MRTPSAAALVALLSSPLALAAGEPAPPPAAGVHRPGDGG